MQPKRYTTFQKTFALLFLALGLAIGGRAQYCTSSLYDFGCSDGDNIESFSTTGGTTNITNNNTGCNSPVVGFTYFSNISHTAAAGSTVNFSITNNIDFAELYKIWVDWNSDFDFTDPGEEMYSMGLLDGQTATGSFVIPASAAAGTKRLRVRCVFAGLSPFTACSFEEYGEIEDYNLIVSGTTPPCNAPTGLAASAVTTTGATLSWTAASGATGYEYVLSQTATSPTGAGTPITATTFSASGLTPSTTYYFHLRTRCGANTFSSWTMVSFTTSATTPACTIPTGLAASSITSTSATLLWTAVTGATGYEYILDQVPANPTGVGAALITTTFPTGGLTPSTTYYFHLRTRCGTTTFSPWTVVSFTTTAATSNCTIPTSLVATSVTSNSATIFWTAVTGATGYEYVINQVVTNPAGSGTLTTATAYPATSLAPSTTYYFHMRTKCGTTTFSPWTVVALTTTSSTPGCTLPAALTPTNTSVSTVSLSWTAVSGATGYEYANGTSPTPPAAGTPVTTTTVSLGGLTTGVVYYAHVRTKCGTTFSVWRTAQYTKGTTSVNSSAGSADFNLSASPNPVGNVLTVRAEGVSNNHAAILTLTDVSGRVLRQVPAAGRETMLNLAGIPTGLYLIRYTGEGQSHVLRIQKQ